MKIVLAAISSYPVTLAEAKVHLRVTTSTENDLITALIEAATDYAERHTGRLLAARGVTEYFDGWPVCACGECIDLSIAPFVSLTKVEHIIEGATAYSDWANTNYVLDDKGEYGKIVLAEGATYPDLAELPNSVKVTYTAGATLSKTVKQAILLLVGFWFENREDIPINETRNHRIRSADQLLNMNRLITL